MSGIHEDDLKMCASSVRRMQKRGLIVLTSTLSNRNNFGETAFYTIHHMEWYGGAELA